MRGHSDTSGKKMFLAALILLSLASQTCAQLTEHESIKMDTLRVLNGRVNVFLKSNSYEVINASLMQQTYFDLFNNGKIIYSDGFKLSTGSTLLFYQTDLENHELNDGGLSTWKLIISFTDKIPQNQWIESGLRRMTSGANMYFVKLVSHQHPRQYFKFVFHYVDSKLAFSLFQCPINIIAINPGEPENYLSQVVPSPHPSKFTSLEIK